MTVVCVRCGRQLAIPEDRAANPDLRVKCSCGTVFTLAEARIRTGATPQTAATRDRVQLSCPNCHIQGAIPAAKLSQPGFQLKCRCGVTFSPAEVLRRARPGHAQAMASPPPAPNVSPAPAKPATSGALPPPVSSERIPARPPVGTPREVRPNARAPGGPTPAHVAAKAAVAVPAASVASRPMARRSVGAAQRLPCRNHSTHPAENVCPACGNGFCAECTQWIREKPICTSCDVLCTPVTEYLVEQARSAERERSLFQEIPKILGYPFVDPMAFVLLALFTGFFSWFSFVSVFAVLLSQGVLLSYSFHAVSQVSRGNMKNFMPDFSDISDLVTPLRLGAAVLIISLGPLLVGLFLLIGSLNPMDLLHQTMEQSELGSLEEMPEGFDPTIFQEGWTPGESDETAHSDAEPVSIPSSRVAVSGMALLLVLAALLWKFVYTPVALIVAGVSRGFVQTLNPLLGVDTISRMGSIYWQALIIYFVISTGQFVSGIITGFIPILGTIAQAFVDAYAWLTIGCLLGLAVFKRAPQLDLD